MPFRQEKLESQIKNFSAVFFEREGTNSSMITVTNCMVTKDTKRATIYISVLPESKEDAAYGFAKRNLGQLREFLQKNLNTNIPYLDVTIDKGEKHRQLVDEILRDAKKADDDASGKNVLE